MKFIFLFVFIIACASHSEHESKKMNHSYFDGDTYVTPHFVNKDINGMTVQALGENSFAEKVGLQLGDLILEINSNTIQSLAEWNNLTQGDSKIKDLTILRRGYRLKLLNNVK